MAIDCLAGYIHSEQLDGNEIPSPTPLNKVDPYCEDSDEEDHATPRFVNTVAVDVEEYAARHFNKAVKRTVSIPQWLNDRAAIQKINFSKTLQKALMKELNIAGTV